MRVPKTRILTAACRSDFLSFFHLCFHILNPNTTLQMNWHHQALAYDLELVREGRIRRLIINLPRRSLKSFLTSVAFPAYALGHDPSKRIVVASYGADLAVKLSNDFRAIVNDPFYRAMFPRMQISGAKNTESEVATTLNGYRFATTIEGSLAGRGGDILIIDDPHKPGDVVFETSRNRVYRWFCDTALPALDDKQNGAVLLVMQRLHVDDLTGTVLRPAPKVWTVLSLPAIATSDEKIPIGHKYHFRQAGDLLHCEREPRHVLDALLLQFGDEVFAAQYQQQPLPPGGTLIKREWIQYYDRLPALIPSAVFVQSWDPAMKSNDSNARSAGTTWLFQEDKYYLVDLFVGQLDYSDLKQRAIELAGKYKPVAILIEDAVVGTGMANEFEKLGLPAVLVKPKEDKKTRMAKHIPKFANGQVLFPGQKPWCAEAVREVVDFPGGRRTDIVDSISQALDYNPNTFDIVKAADGMSRFVSQLLFEQQFWGRVR
jgi:predicted phage terminase large subunit-like protein